MVECSLLNLGTCLPQKFFEFIAKVITAPVQPFLQLTLKLLSEPVNLSLFFNLWAIIVYLLSLFYALLLVGTGVNFIISGYDSEKRERAKSWLRNTLIMIILVQASFFIYELGLTLSSLLTSSTLSLVDPNFFLIGVDSITDLSLSLLCGGLYILTLLIIALVLIIRYALVAIGVVLFPVAIFFYFVSPLRAYGSFMLNLLGGTMFVTFFDAVLLTGFSKLAEVGIFADFKILLLITAFLVMSLLMLFLMFFSLIKGALSIYHGVKSIGGRK